MLRSSFDEKRFRQQVDAALAQISKILSTTRSVSNIDSSPHKFEDKFSLASFFVNTSIAASHTCLSQFGASDRQLAQLVTWGQTDCVTLRFRNTLRCTFLREEKAKQYHDDKVLLIIPSTVTTTTVVHLWRLDNSWEIEAFRGTGGDVIQLSGRDSSCIVSTLNKSPPHPVTTVLPPIDLDLTWLLSKSTLKPGVPASCFEIDRSTHKCRTPRRNPDVDAAFDFFSRFYAWAKAVDTFFTYNLFPNQFSPETHHLRATSVNKSSLAAVLGPDQELDREALNARDIFVPIAPFLETTGVPSAPRLTVQPSSPSTMVPASPGASPSASASAASAAGTSPAAASTVSVVEASGPSSPAAAAAGALVAPAVPDTAKASLLTDQDASDFIFEQRQSFGIKYAQLKNVFPHPHSANAYLLSLSEAVVVVALRHTLDLCQALVDAVGYLEHLLRQQLVAALGREVSSADFGAFQRFHARRMFAARFEPRLFSHAVRRPDHFPEGVVSIEAASAGSSAADEPIETMMRSIGASDALEMHFALNAATVVKFRGERHVYGWIATEFAGVASASAYHLKARANQFSSYLLMVGTIGSATLFEPKHAIVVQNKNEISIPLLLEQLPSAKEFKDAISSLSPEQQRFAKAVRGMQLEGTVFAVCILQLKPQLEKVLNLPEDSLTKEVALCQRLLELFQRYQIPSDLLAYDGDADAAAAAKIAAVDANVAAIEAMIKEAKLADVNLTLAKAIKAQEELLQQIDGSLSSANSLPRRRGSESPVYRGGGDKSGGGGDRGFGSSRGGRGGGGGGGFLRSSRRSEDSSAPSRGILATAGLGGGSVSLSRSEPLADHALRGDLLQAGLIDDVPSPSPSLPVAQSAASSSSSSSSSSKASTLPSSSPTPSSAPSASPSSSARVDTLVPTSDAAAVVTQRTTQPDFTQLPAQIDARLGALGADAVLRPTTIKLADAWQKRTQTFVGSGATSSSVLLGQEQQQAKHAAFDLIDALTRSGALPFVAAELHVVIALTHCFDRSLIDTVVCDNVNPLEQLERSCLTVASVLHALPAVELIAPRHVPVIAASVDKMAETMVAPPLNSLFETAESRAVVAATRTQFQLPIPPPPPPSVVLSSPHVSPSADRSPSPESVIIFG